MPVPQYRLADHHVPAGQLTRARTSTVSNRLTGKNAAATMAPAEGCHGPRFPAAVHAASCCGLAYQLLVTFAATLAVMPSTRAAWADALPGWADRWTAGILQHSSAGGRRVWGARRRSG